MNYQHQSIIFYGLQLDSFITEDDRTWVTLTSLAKGVGVHQQTTQNWLKSEGVTDRLEVRVGPRRNTKAWAYPVEVAVAYLAYLADRGKPGVIRVVTKSLCAELDRSVMDELSSVQTPTT